MRTRLKGLFWVIEINLVLWLVVLVLAIRSAEVPLSLKYTVGAGCVLSALLQHWAYYNLRKPKGVDKDKTG